MIYPIYKNRDGDVTDWRGNVTGLKELVEQHVIAFADSSDNAKREVQRLNLYRAQSEIDDGLHYTFGHGRKGAVYLNGVTFVTIGTR